MKYVIANWKMNIPDISVEEYIEILEDQSDKVKIIIAPPLLYAWQFKNKSPDIEISAQHMSDQDMEFGPYTGEVSARMIKESGMEYVIIGHSERRIQYNETLSQIKKKLLYAFKMGLTPIVCIGETAEYRESGNWKNFLKMQIQEVLGADESYLNHSAKKIIIAYEPAWSIGTGMAASSDQIREAIDIIQENISVVAKNVKIVYGGSVTEKNALELRSLPHLSGVLVGKASLDPQNLVQIIKNYA